MQNINLEDYKGVYVFAQQVDNELSGIAFELLGEAGRLAKPLNTCLLYTSPSPRDKRQSRMPSSA